MVFNLYSLIYSKPSGFRVGAEPRVGARHDSPEQKHEACDDGESNTAEKLRVKSIRGFTLIELLVSITLSMLIVMSGLSYYQWSMRELKKQQQEVSEELTLRNMVHWFEEDFNHAGWMGCRFWGESVTLETDVSEVSAISTQVGLKAVWHGLVSDPLVSHYLDSTTYKVVSGSPVVWIQKTMPYTVGRPVVSERCDRIAITRELDNHYQSNSFSSVLWFIADHKEGHRGIYRRDLFGQTDEVLREVFSMTIDWDFSEGESQENAVLKIRFSETGPVRSFKI